MDAPDHYQTTYVSKTKIVVFYSLNNVGTNVVIMIYPSSVKFTNDNKVENGLHLNKTDLSESEMYTNWCSYINT